MPERPLLADEARSGCGVAKEYLRSSSLALTATSCHNSATVAPGYHEYAYVTNGKSNSVSVLDLLQLRNVKTIAVGAGPTGVAASPTRNEIYVANADSNNISIISAETNEVVCDHRSSCEAVLRFGFVRRQACVRRQFGFRQCFSDRSGEESGDCDHPGRRSAGNGEGFARRQAGGGQQSRRQFRFDHRCRQTRGAATR